MKKESAFESHLTTCSAFFGCYYVKVPDMIPTRDRVRSYHDGSAPEALKPFDGILITPTGSFCLELKQGSNHQTTNQMTTESRINKINPVYYVVRKSQKAHKDVFTIEQDSQVLFSTDRIEYLIQAFKQNSFTTSPSRHLATSPSKALATSPISQDGTV